MLDDLQREVVELDLSGSQVLRVLQVADVKADAGGDLPDRPKGEMTAAQNHGGLPRGGSCSHYLFWLRKLSYSV